MKTCKRCGNEMQEDTKFCPNCGEAAENNDSAEQDCVKAFKIAQESQKPRFGRFFAILLFVLAIIDFMSDPAAVTILLSVVLLVGCIYCLRNRYKFKAFSVVALIIAVFSLFAGIKQASEVGLLKIPDFETEMIEMLSEGIDEMYDAKNNASSGQHSLTASKEETKKDSSIEKNNETAIGVDPKLKAFLDSYESFIDEYVVFMNKYMSNPSDAFSLLSEYTDIMAKYEAFAEKLDKYDSDDMSAADAQYYLEVVNRCSMKMLAMY